MLRIQSKASRTLSQCSATELYFHPFRTVMVSMYLYAHITYEYMLSLISPNYVSESSFKRRASLCIRLCGGICVFNTLL